ARCEDATPLVAPLWDDATRGRVAAAFRATERPYADAAFDSVDASLRARLDAWARQHREVCAATRERHEQSDTMMDLRMRCLARARGELASMVAELGTVDAVGVARAPGAAASVGDLAACADVATLASAAQPPRDPAVAAEVEVLRGE